MSVTFDKSLETGNELIDQQHKELIDRVNKLLESCYMGTEKRTAIQTLNFLLDYTEFHFQAEEKLQEESSRLGKLGRMIGEGMSVREYVETELSAFHPHHIGHTPIGFSCPCTRESFTSYLSSLPAAEKDEILKGEFPLELECLNCGSRYSYTKEEFERIHKGA